jgi:hypothetical protein
MNQVDIYIGDYRLDLFNDEEISINLSVQNVQDISKVFTDFTQSFTVPASGWNNEVLRHYYRTDVDAVTITKKQKVNAQSTFESYEARVLTDLGVVEARDCCISALEALGDTYFEKTYSNTFDFRLRPSARIEINSIPFRTGVLEMENVQIQNNEPYAYSLSFYGDLVNLSDLFGEDYLYDLDLSSLNHNYDGATIQTGLDQDALESGNVFYPLMSPKTNWYYNSNASDVGAANIANNGSGTVHGIHYYELKPAVKVAKILEAIEDKYGIVLTGDFLTTSPFTKLYLWAHRYEGWMYEGQPKAMSYEKVNFNHTAAPTPDYFNLTTDTFTPEGVSGSGDVYDIYYDVSITSYTDDYYLAVIKNGYVISEQLLNGSQTGTFEDIAITNYVDEVYLAIKPSTSAPIVYQFNQCTFTAISTSQLQANVDQTLSATYQGATVDISELMPEIKVKDFMAGLMKMHNLVIIPNSATSFNLQTLNDWYGDGTDQNLTSFMDIAEVSINRPPLYREIDFEYKETKQILGEQYQKTNPLGVGYGDLNAVFNFDASDFKISLPFECPLFERQTDQDTSSLTNVLAYKSITRQANNDGELNPYLGAPIFIYGEFSLDISSNPLYFVDESNTAFPIDQVWYANTSSTSLGVGTAYSLNWGADIDPFYLVSVNNGLYQTYWSDYIEDLYSSKRRIVNVNAVLPLGKIVSLDLKNKVIWNNQKWIVNSATVNMTTGKTTFQLLNVL